jgi:hypothetical protein
MTHAKYKEVVDRLYALYPHRVATVYQSPSPEKVDKKIYGDFCRIPQGRGAQKKVIWGFLSQDALDQFKLDYSQGKFR